MSTTQTVSDAVATREGISGFIDPYRGDFAEVLPSHVSAEQWLRLVTGTLRQNAKLAAVAKSNPGSLLAAMFDCARLGLVIGDTYHLVPFGNEIVGIADYTGLIELMFRAGVVRSVHCEVVYSDDEFHYDPGAMDRPTHRPDWFSSTGRGRMIGAYAYAVLGDGAVSQVIVRSALEIEQVRKVSRSSAKPDSPWQQWPDRMWRKTVLRELMKFVPTSAEYRQESVRAAAAANQISAARQLPAPTSDLLDGEVLDGPDWPEVASPAGGQ